VRRDEQDALRRFGNAANLGDPLAMFNLGYMHMRGVGTEVNHTEARRLFEKAASLDVAAAHNGVGVLDYNGWATADGAPNVVAARARFEAGAAAGDPDASFNLGTLHQTGAGGLPVDHSLAYARYQAASDAGHWRAPLAVAKLTLEGWHPPSDGLSAKDASSEETRSERDEELVIDESVGVERNCREAARLVMAFVEERLIVFADEHEAALAALEGGFVDDAFEGAAELKAHAKETISETENDASYFDETEVGPDPWSALVRYALIAERGGEAGLANAAFLAKKAGAAKSKSTFFNANGAPLPRHVTRRAARDAAREALTRLAAMGDVEARVDLGDIEWAAAVEGDEEETEETEVAFDRAFAAGSRGGDVVEQRHTAPARGPGSGLGFGRVRHAAASGPAPSRFFFDPFGIGEPWRRDVEPRCVFVSAYRLRAWDPRSAAPAGAGVAAEGVHANAPRGVSLRGGVSARASGGLGEPGVVLEPRRGRASSGPEAGGARAVEGARRLHGRDGIVRAVGGGGGDRRASRGDGSLLVFRGGGRRGRVRRPREVPGPGLRREGEQRGVVPRERPGDVPGDDER
jgi:TPR repeat protein